MTRRPSRTLGIWIIAAASALLLTACQTTDSGSSSAASQTQEAEGGFVAPAEPSGASAVEPVTNLELRPVYFGYDRSELTEEARASLREDAKAMGSASGSTTIEGHTDERGTFEYNLALGDRRANVVKKYLVALGLPASKIRTKSYGEANPAVKGHDESAWRWNRRAVLSQ